MATDSARCCDNQSLRVWDSFLNKSTHRRINRSRDQTLAVPLDQLTKPNRILGFAIESVKFINHDAIELDARRRNEALEQLIAGSRGG